MSEPEAKTKQCDTCDAVIAKDAESCPACGTDLAELEETIKALDRAELVRKKRADRAKPTSKGNTQDPPIASKKVSIFRKLADVRKEKANAKKTN